MLNWKQRLKDRCLSTDAYSTYLDKLHSGKAQKSENYDLELLYSGQIVINSRVALVKFKQFDLAILFTLTAILSPIGALLVYKLRK